MVFNRSKQNFLQPHFCTTNNYTNSDIIFVRFSHDNTRCLFLMLLSFFDFFMRFDNIFFSYSHLLIGASENFSLLGCFNLKLTCHLGYIIHNILSCIELHLSFLNNVSIEVYFSFYSQCLLVNLLQLLLLIIIIIIRLVRSV